MARTSLTVLYLLYCRTCIVCVRVCVMRVDPLSRHGPIPGESLVLGPGRFVEDPKETFSTLDTIPGYGMAVYRQIVYLQYCTLPGLPSAR